MITETQALRPAAIPGPGGGLWARTVRPSGFLWGHSYREGGSPRNHCGGQVALEGESKFSEATGSAPAGTRGCYPRRGP